MYKNKYVFFLVITLILLVGILILYNNFIQVEGFGGKSTAIIIEPRKHKALSYVLENFLKNLPDNWDIVIMHGTQNEEYVENILNTDLQSYKSRITKKNLYVDNLSISDYNNLLKSPSFYDNIPTETFLIFQTDSVICDENKDLLDGFLKYDYVGAPWKDAVGNGGLSLRKKSKMLEIISKCPKDEGNEDIYFANPCIDSNKPSIEEAKKFSVEKLFNKDSFGVHKPWAYLDAKDLDAKKDSCKSLSRLIDLNM